MVLTAMVAELDTVHDTPRRSLQLLGTLGRVLGDGRGEGEGSDASEAGATGAPLSWDVAEGLVRSVADHIRRLRGQASDESVDRQEAELPAAAVEAQRRAVEVRCVGDGTGMWTCWLQEQHTRVTLP